MVDAEARPYTDLGAAAGNKSADKLRRLAEQHLQLFTTDGNLGLVKQVVARVTQRAIQRLTATFLTLSLQEVAAAVGLQGGAQEAEELLLRWGAEGALLGSGHWELGSMSWLHVCMHAVVEELLWWPCWAA
jgi:COP9 signalosome complex subunit 3